LILLSFRRRRYSSKPRHGPPGEPIKAEGRTRTFLKSLFNLKKKKNSKNQKSKTNSVTYSKTHERVKMKGQGQQFTSVKLWMHLKKSE
jgi:hypothetical protein